MTEEKYPDRERRREPVVERNVAFVVPGERAFASEELGRQLPVLGFAVVRLEEPVHLAAVPLKVASTPFVVGVRETRLVRMKPIHRLAARLRDLLRNRDRVGRRVDRKLDGLSGRIGHVRACPLREVPEVAVERTVLLHEHEDVFDRDLLTDGQLRPEGLVRQCATLELAGESVASGGGVVDRTRDGAVPLLRRATALDHVEQHDAPGFLFMPGAVGRHDRPLRRSRN
jgi:hypothetical protein